jgi:hypothetical protein
VTESAAATQPEIVAKGREMDFPGVGPWATLAVICGIDAIWLLISARLSLDLSSTRMTLLSAGLIVFFAAYCRSRADLRLQRVATPLIGALFIVLAFTALRVLNHLTMSIPFPLADDGLARLDAMLGLDWLTYAKWVAAHPLIVTAFGLAYTGLALVVLAAFVALWVAGRIDRAKEFVRLVFSTGLAATVIGAAFPAKAAMDRFASLPLRGIFGPTAGVYHLPYLQSLRSGLPHVLNLHELPGMVVIPSYHTACALLIMYACRGIPILQVLAIFYSVVMIASTPIMGGHYFIDLICGGILVAIVLLVDRRVSYSVGKIFQRIPRPAREMTTQLR